MQLHNTDEIQDWLCHVYTEHRLSMDAICRAWRLVDCYSEQAARLEENRMTRASSQDCLIHKHFQALVWLSLTLHNLLFQGSHFVQRLGER
jgi:hypothetical protein